LDGKMEIFFLKRSFENLIREIPQKGSFKNLVRPPKLGAKSPPMAACRPPPVHLNCNPHHVLRRLYHEKEACGNNLRTRPHDFALPVKGDHNFVSRSLYAELKT